MLERSGGGDPVVLLLDDVHLAGAAVADWLRYVLGRPSRLLVVAAARSGEGDVPAGRTVELGPLPLPVVAELVGPDRAGALFARSGGHPLFLAELAAADPGDALPESLRAWVAAQCDRAGDAGPTLRAAATIGPEIDLDLLAAVLDASPLAVLGQLEEGARRRLLDERDGQLRFRHALVREALAAGTPGSRRAALHRQAARILAGRPDADPLRVAHHASHGGDGALAVRALLRAADLAGQRFDYRHQEELLDRALAITDGVEARLARARVRIALGRYAEAGADAAAAVDAGAGAAGLALAGWAAYYSRDLAAARRYADDGARIADTDAVRAACLTLAGRIRHSAGEIGPAEQRLEQAVALATGRESVVPSVFLGVLRSHLGQVDEALALLSPGTHAAADHPQPFTHLHALMVSAQTLGTLGRPAEALAALDRMYAAIDDQHALRFRGAAHNFRSWLLRNLGALGEADDLNQLARDLGREATRGEVAEHTLLDLADGRLRANDLAGAEALLAELGATASTGSAFAWRRALRQRLLGARLAVVTGEHATALSIVESLDEAARAARSPRYVALAALLGARARAGLGRSVEPDEIAGAVAALDRLAGVEAWWLTAEVAEALDVDAWRRLAERRAARLAAAAGDRGDDLRRYARRLLG